MTYFHSPQTYHGKRYLSIARTSTDKQEASIDDQLTANRRLGDELNMTLVEVMQLAGVSGSRPGNRHDLEQLIERKKQRNDFDFLILYDHSRLTRFGAMHGMSILWAFEKVGVKILFAVDGPPSGPYAHMMAMMHFMAANDFAQKLARDSARGQMSAILDGRRPHSTLAIYGTDRLILANDNQPKFILRNQADGWQLKLALDGQKVLERFPPKQHYRKQRAERFDLIPGDPRHVAVVIRIYQLRFLEGWGPRRIAKRLNDEGIPAPRGGRWHVWMVKDMLRKTVYTGFGWTNQFDRAVYYNRGAEGPKAVEMNIQERATSNLPPRKLRPKEEWFRVELRHLRDFLPEAIREAAMAAQQQYWDRKAANRKPPRRDRHVDSPYLLKGLLFEASSGLAMSGRRKGTAKYRRRYYGVSKSRHTPTSCDGTLTRCVPAEPLEKIVLNAMVVAIARLPHLRQRLGEQLAKQAEAEVAPDQRQALEAQLAQIKALQERILVNQDCAPDIAREQLLKASAERSAIERRLEQVTAAKPQADADLDARLDRLIEELTDQRSELFTAPPETVRRLIRLLVPRVEVDVATRQARFEVRLPDWALAGPIAWGLKEGCEFSSLREAHILGLNGGGEFSPLLQAHQGGRVLYRCMAFWGGKTYFGFGKAA